MSTPTGVNFNPTVPVDKGGILYMTLVLHGLGAMIAWNMFITAKDYFVKYKLKDSTYADRFLVYLGYASHTPNFLFSWFNVFIVLRGSLMIRIIVTLIMEVFIFVLTIFLAMVDSSGWADGFFWVTMVSVFFLHASNAVYQNCVFGVAGRLPAKYTGAVVLGNNLCGTLVTLLNWVSASFGGSLKSSAIYYFIGGMVVFLACLDSYFALPLNRFYRYYDSLQQKSSAAKELGENSPKKIPYLMILKQCWVQLYNVWLVFVVSIGIFPAIHSDIRSMGDFLGDNFVRVTCFLTFNFTALIGNITANYFQYPTRRWLWVATTSRIAFIPLFLMCNYQPSGVTRTMRVVITSDAVYWVLSVLLGWTSGHFSSLAMMYVGGKVDPEYVHKAVMIGGAILITGILSGIALSGLGPTIVSMSIWG
ncbi:equilibrative nucleoside transporter 3-like [Pectinophora gossypiella]|uniref:equilibrative nucleoside transporter 3-like n=1 Tax=Pectinophora gossypiella TaxID=13191 RepID=UPI00214E9044|nr:equilibrative nucleoside transporter 3-like [Pectinophora gossypiella]